MTAASLPFPTAAIPAVALSAPAIPPGSQTAGDEFSALITSLFAATAETTNAMPATAPKPVARPLPANDSPPAAAVFPSSTPPAAETTGDESTALISPPFAGSTTTIVDAAPAPAPKAQGAPLELDRENSSKSEYQPERLPSFFAGFSIPGLSIPDYSIPDFSIPGFASPAELPRPPLANVFAAPDVATEEAPTPPLAEPDIAGVEVAPREVGIASQPCAPYAGLVLEFGVAMEPPSARLANMTARKGNAESPDDSEEKPAALPPSSPTPAAPTPAPFAAPVSAPVPAAPADPPTTGRSDPRRPTAAPVQPVSGPAAAPPETSPVPPAAPDGLRQPLSVLAPATQAELPEARRSSSVKTEIAFVARLIEHSAESAAPAQRKQVAAPNKEQSELRLPDPPAGAGLPTERFRRPAADAGTESALPERGAVATKAADSHLEPVAPAMLVPPQLISARPAAEGKPPAPVTPAAPADFEPAHADVRPQPVRDISLLVPQRAEEGRRPEGIEVRLLDRAGQVHVTVRSADAQLNRALGEQLGELVTKLDRSGYRAETWRPADSPAVASGIPAASETSAQQFRDGASREGFSGWGNRNQDAAGEESSQQQRHDQQQARPEWLETLDGSFSQAGNSIRSTFHDIAH